jgi:guanosine-3',5'-bis(diphosphate) 3'-pyrophosphohydrolase
MSDSVSKLLLAASYAAQQHRDQRRKNDVAAPYINHPLSVASLLANEGGVVDVDLLIAALLHDTVEDTSTSNAELTELFGSEVSYLVSEVTDDKSLPKAQRKQLQIDQSPGKSERARQLKIADKICNVRDINASSPASWGIDRKVEYLDWAARVVDGCRGVNQKLDQLFDQELIQARTRLQA